MAFPSTSGSMAAAAQDLPGASIAARVKSKVESVSRLSAQGPMSAKSILNMHEDLCSARDYFNRLRQVPGIAAYAQALLNEPTIDLAAEFTDMLAQIESTIAWTVTNFPVSSGWLQVMQWNGDRFEWRTLSTAALAAYRSQLDAVAATID